MYRINYEPNYQSVLPLLSNLNDDSLKEFVNNDEAVDELVKNCDQNKELETEKELIMTKNKSLAEYNLSLGPKLEEGKSKLMELYESVQGVWDSVQEKQSQLRSSSGDITEDTALALLQTAAAEIEEESEDIVDKFYNKEIEVEDFLDQFKKARKLMHLRRVKVDKMKELMHKRLEYQKPSIPSVPYPVGINRMPFYPMLK